MALEIANDNKKAVIFVAAFLLSLLRL